MSRPLHAARLKAVRITVVVSVIVAALLVCIDPASAARRYTRSASAVVTVSRTASVTATAWVTATESVTVSGVTRTATVKLSGTATASGSSRVSVRASGTATASTAATAQAQALAAARATASASAAQQARDQAHDRAFATAYPVAYQRAAAAAHTSAASKAKSAATAAAADAGPTCNTAPLAKPGGGYWACTFDDEFDGTTLDRTRWVPITTLDSATTDGGRACFVDSPNNVAQSGGYLQLTVRKEAAPLTCTQPSGSFTTQYTAGEVATIGKFSQAYGRFAVRASFPKVAVAGLQSALWLWPTNATHYGETWPASGEIDIAESYSMFADRAIPFVHYNLDPASANTSTDTNVVTNNYCLLDDLNAFHDYVLEWTPTTMTISYDGQTCLVDHYRAAGMPAGAPFDQPFFVVLTQALGSGANVFAPASTPLPATTRVDWVRVWK